MPDSYEANFEVEAQPIEINLELKQYVEVSERQRLVVLDFYVRDWKPEKDLYKVEILAETHTLAKFSFNSFLLYDEETELFTSALCDYAINETEGTVVLYSDYPCRCKVILFGEGLV